MARHLSVVVIMAIAIFVVLSFMTSFGDRTERIRQVMPVTGVSERPLTASEATAPDTKASTKADTPTYTKPDIGKDGKTDTKTHTKPDVKPDAKSGASSDFAPLSSQILTGDAIAPKLENATIK